MRRLQTLLFTISVLSTSFKEMKVRIKNNNTVYTMETIVFVITAIMCTCIIVISETLDRISSIEKYNKSMETIVQHNYEHIMMCILYKAVHIPESIHGFKITVHGPQFVNFKDVFIFDTKEVPILYKINRQKATYGYQCSKNSTNHDNHKDLVVEFHPVVFTYIEFDNFQIGNTKVVRIILLLENQEIAINMKQKEKNIICNTAAYSSSFC